MGSDHGNTLIQIGIDTKTIPLSALETKNPQLFRFQANHGPWAAHSRKERLTRKTKNQRVAVCCKDGVIQRFLNGFTQVPRLSDQAGCR